MRPFVLAIVLISASASAHAAGAIRASDGEPYLVRDVNPGTYGSDPERYTLFEDIVLFSALGNLYRTDGASTDKVSDEIFGVVAITTTRSSAFVLGGSVDNRPTLW